MRQKNRRIKKVEDFFKNLLYSYERNKLEREYAKYDDCTPMREYYSQHPDEEKILYDAYHEDLKKLKKKYDR